MGNDAYIYAEGNITSATIAAAEEWMVSRHGLPDLLYARWFEHHLNRPGRVVLNTLQRYYGPAYERGDWPIIYGYIRAVRKLFPKAAIHYGSDNNDFPPLADEASCQRIWDHYLGPQGAAYFEEWE